MGLGLTSRVLIYFYNPIFPTFWLSKKQKAKLNSNKGELTYNNANLNTPCLENPPYLIPI